MIHREILPIKWQWQHVSHQQTPQFSEQPWCKLHCIRASALTFSRLEHTALLLFLLFFFFAPATLTECNKLRPFTGSRGIFVKRGKSISEVCLWRFILVIQVDPTFSSKELKYSWWGRLREIMTETSTLNLKSQIRQYIIKNWFNSKHVFMSLYINVCVFTSV